MKKLFDYVFFAVCTPDDRQSRSLYRIEIRCEGVENPGIKMTKLKQEGPSALQVGGVYVGNYLRMDQNIHLRFGTSSYDGPRTSRIALLITDEVAAREAFALEDLVPMDPRFNTSTPAVLAELAGHELVV